MARMNWEGARSRERARGPYDPDLREGSKPLRSRPSGPTDRLAPGKPTAESLAKDWAKVQRRTREERLAFEAQVRKNPGMLALPKRDLSVCIVHARTAVELEHQASELRRERAAVRKARRTGAPPSALETLKQQAAREGLTLQEMSARTRVPPNKGNRANRKGKGAAKSRGRRPSGR